MFLILVLSFLFRDQTIFSDFFQIFEFDILKKYFIFYFTQTCLFDFTQHYFLKIFIGVQLIYNIVLILGAQQSEYVHSFLRFFSHIGHYRVLSRVPCAIQQVLISYLFYIQQCVYVNPNLPTYPSPLTTCLFSKFVFYICDSTSVL